ESAWAGRAAAVAARTYEFVEFLVRVQALDPEAIGANWKGRVTFHSSCHLRGLDEGVSGSLARDIESFLRRIPGVDFTPLEGAEQCCGFGGMFSVKSPSLSGAMAGEKAAQIAATQCPVVVCNEPGCAMNIEGACRRRGPAPTFLSLAEVLAEGLGLLE